MQNVNVKVFNYAELSKEAQDVVIKQHLRNDWYDYSDHEKSEYGASLAVFNATFIPTADKAELKGESAKEAIVVSVNNACKIQANANKYNEESFKQKYNSKIANQQDALDAIANCVLTGVSTDFYLMDTITKFLQGKEYQDLNLKQLVIKAKENARNELNKQCRYYRSRAHTHECLLKHCQIVFFEDGMEVPVSVLHLLAA